jgi:hypothetical protein
MSTEKIKVVKIDTDPAIKSLKDLRAELNEFKNQMANLDEGSEEFLELANKAGEAKHKIDEINESIKGASSDFGDMLGNISNVAAGITGAFQAVSGGLQAMGLKSEAIDKTLVKMQGLMAVTDGLSKMDTALKSWDKLEHVIGTNAYNAVLKFSKALGGIGIAVGVVAALTTGFIKLKDRLDGTAEALRQRETAQKKFNTALEKELEIRKRAGYSEEELVNFEIAKLELRQQQLKKDNQNLQRQSDEAYRKAKELEKAQQKYAASNTEAAAIGISTVTGVTRKYTEQIEANNAEINENNARLQEQKNLLEIIIEAKKLAAQRTKTQTDAETEGTEEVVDATAAANKAYDAKIEKLQHAGYTEQKIIEETIKIEKQRLGLYKKDSLEYEQIETKIYNLNKRLEDEKKNATREDIDKQIAMWKYKVETEVELDEKGNEKKKYTLEDYYNKVIELEEQWLTKLDKESKDYYDQLIIINELKKAKAELNGVDEISVDRELEELKDLAKQWKQTLQTPKEWFDEEVAKLDKLKELKLLSDEEYIGAKKQLEKELADWEKRLNEDVVSDKKEKALMSLEVAAVAFEGIGSILSELASQQEAESEEGFEKQKKLQIGAATMNTLTGIIGAWTSSMSLPAPFSFITAGIQTAVAAALGALQIKKIKETTFDGGGSSNISSSALASTIIPPVQYSNAVQGASTEGAIKDTKVYVTETDIKNTANKVSVQETENTY